MKSYSTFPKISQQPYVVFWFRRDLRLNDNAGLYRALKSGLPVVPVFIFDSNILNALDDKQDARVHFIHNYLIELNQELKTYGSSLQIFHATPTEVYAEFEKDQNCYGLFTNKDYEPYAIKRDTNVAELMKDKPLGFQSFKDHVVFEKGEVVKGDGSPYTVFTPYSKVWLNTLTDFYKKPYPSEKYATNLLPISKTTFPTLADIGFSESDIDFPDKNVNTSLLSNYQNTRDIPSIRGTSRLSVHLRFGTVSIRELVNVAQKHSQKWLMELVWRDFYQMILFHFPHSVDKAFKPQYDQVEWRNNETEFEAWCKGKTGYPIVDAGMRELNSTGFMHNRVRMIVASFLTKHLLIDWRWGERYFAKKLLDFDLASNVGGWQWAASSGCDAAPYFRVFNPELQTKKFDPELKYIKQWVPEFQELTYPKPIVDHKFARERVLKAYKEALDRKA